MRLLARRAAGATICPSEAARELADGSGDGWRPWMPTVHEAAAALAARGDVVLSWKGKARAPGAGPYRIARR